MASSGQRSPLAPGWPDDPALWADSQAPLTGTAWGAGG